MLNKTVLVLLGALLDLLALRCDVALQLVGVPLVVWLYNIVLPVLLNQILQVLAVCRCWVWDVVVREPTLELSLVPLVIC